MPRATFTEDEILLCAYAARFEGDDFGGVEAIHTLTGRSRASIHLKILNIAAMLDEEGIARESKVTPLSGLPTGQRGRRTNWDIVLPLTGLSRQQHLAECQKVLELQAALPVKLTARDPFSNGAARQMLFDRYERDPAARRACLDHYGTACVVCGFSFSTVYGPFADGFIHVHHVKPFAEIGNDYVVDAVTDLRPVCPNCHEAIHLNGVTRSVEELQQLVAERLNAGPSSELGVSAGPSCQGS